MIADHLNGLEDGSSREMTCFGVGDGYSAGVRKWIVGCVVVLSAAFFLVFSTVRFYRTKYFRTVPYCFFVTRKVTVNPSFNRAVLPLGQERQLIRQATATGALLTYLTGN